MGQKSVAAVLREMSVVATMRGMSAAATMRERSVVATIRVKVCSQAAKFLDVQKLVGRTSSGHPNMVGCSSY